MDPMAKKTATQVATESSAQAALRRGVTRELDPDEERVLRMRLGAVPPRAAPLQPAADLAGDLGIELLAAEIEAHLRLRAHRRATAGAAVATRAAPTPSTSRRKDKIIRALRRKG
jgi:hypothetical protein